MEEKVQKEKKKWGSLLLFIGVCLIIEVVSSIFTMESVDGWYLTLRKPFWTPPGWVFGPVWTILYISIAVSGWLVYVSKAPKKYIYKGLAIWGFELLFNFIWSFFFFYLQSTILGLIDIIILDVLVLINILYFWKISKVAGAILLPYFFWILYATTLNAGIYLMN